MNQLIELGLSDQHQPGRQYQKIHQPTNKKLTRLQVAMFFNEAASNALDDLSARVDDWNNYYAAEVLDAAIVALQAIRDLVNR